MSNRLIKKPGFAGPARLDAAEIGSLASECLRLEIHTYPKPGLVSHVDQGAHADMDCALLEASAEALQPFFQQLYEAGEDGVEMSVLREIGLAAEAAMLCCTGGVNTHRGAIFGLGLLCAATGWRAARRDPAALGQIVARHWGTAILAGPRVATSHGTLAQARYGTGGARVEAATGYPSLYDTALPALRHARAVVSEDENAARVQCCMALIAEVDDTNLLHRGGQAGLNFARVAARRFLNAGGVGAHDWQSRASDMHHAFIDRRLSPGGCADLLGMALFLDILEA
ncbi:MAG: triphosphoribosyl-dephospho-CoA synthase MdcB [Proteobacteria bacterium]|nr:triphosphoribosyl-dephospho-CoA synthase MdcB [Pseudomonadota bacterium]MBU6425207.1 triphosphoribosyl-dephospho-CoA synthase MdcB [Rhodospirillales bacterium]